MQNVMKNEMIRPCSKCHNGNMYSETQPIPKQIPIPIPIVSSINISVEEYLPWIMKKYNSYTVFICEFCGNLEFALS